MKAGGSPETDGPALLGYALAMSIFDEKRVELERHEFMMGVERGRLAVALDLLTDSLILVGQHGVYCASSRNPAKPALDLQAVLGGLEGAKALIQSVMEELRTKSAASGV
jgi:hypothetical protein